MKNVILMITATLLMIGCAYSPGLKSSGQGPYQKPDESWISISGTVVETNSDSFLLDYGEGLITVEMDDWAWYNNDFRYIDDNQVIVYGRIDDDLYESTTIEAATVYDKDLGTYFYASAADEEYGDYDYWFEEDVELGETTVRGSVTGVRGREFTIDTGPRKLTVNTEDMAYNPMDDKGYQKVEKGDYVRVNGGMDYNFWDGRELVADRVVTLIKD